MVAYYIGIPLLMLAAVIDSSVLVNIRYLNGQPSFVLMLVISWGLLNEFSDGLPWAIIGGAFADLLSVTPTGTSSLGYVLSLLVITNVFGQVGRRNFVIPSLAGGLATVILHAVTLIMLIFIGDQVPVQEAFVTWTIPSIIYNVVGIFFVFRLMGGLIEFFRPPRSTL